MRTSKITLEKPVKFGVLKQKWSENWNTRCDIIVSKLINKRKMDSDEEGEQLREGQIKFNEKK